MVIRKNYAQELEALHNHLTELGSAAKRSVHKAITAYINRDPELAHELFSDDLRINASTADIEKEAHRIIALQQPVASDLRMLFAVLHISLDLERIADHAVSIARAVLRRNPEEEDVESITNNLREMANLAEAMIEAALNAYIAKDASAARKIAAEDERMDAWLKEIYRDSAKHMQKNPDIILTGISYIGISNNLERIGDYVTNICERVVFLNTGEIIELN